jgi:hypothetical protein
MIDSVTGEQVRKSALDRRVYAVYFKDRGAWTRVPLIGYLTRRELVRGGMFRMMGRNHGHVKVVNKNSAHPFLEHV